MDLNSVRILVTIASFVLFAGLVVWTWRPKRRVAHDRAAMLPFEGDMDSVATGAQR